MNDAFFTGSEQFHDSIMVIAIATLGLAAYWLLGYSGRAEAYFNRYPDPRKGKILKVVYRRSVGVMCYALLPALAVWLIPNNIANVGLSLTIGREGLYWILALAAVIVPLQVIAARKPGNLKQYPEIRVRQWNWMTVAVNTDTWLFYLLSYEFLIRGVVLFGCLEEMGPLPAAVISTALYTLAHVPKGSREAIGAIPFGLLMCYISVTTGSIWVAFTAHAILALSNDYLALRFNPEMEFVSELD